MRLPIRTSQAVGLLEAATIAGALLTSALLLWSLREREHQLSVEMRARIARDRDVGEIARDEARTPQTRRGGERRKSRLVLQAAEALFLDGAGQVSIDQERGACVAVVGVETENVHTEDGSIQKRRFSKTIRLCGNATLRITWATRPVCGDAARLARCRISRRKTLGEGTTVGPAARYGGSARTAEGSASPFGREQVGPRQGGSRGNSHRTPLD